MKRLINASVEIKLTAICALAIFIAFIGEFSGLIGHETAIIFYLVAYLSGGFYGFTETLKDLKNYEINIDFLMISAAIGAAFIGQWLEGSILLFLFSLSGALEGFALDKSKKAIHSLMELRPNRALLQLPDGREETVPVEQLQIGHHVVVKPGEYIPIDGNVIEGFTDVDQSAITGESVPVAKEAGSQVFAATLNQQGAITIKVTRRSEDTTLAKIIRLVEEAQRNKARTQRFLDRFEPVYAISIVAFVLVLIFIPLLYFGQEFDSVFYRAMTVLVVASPCALIISTPASIISAIANGARNGILFKGGAHIEQTAFIRTIAFDKTGTLTKGEHLVTDIVPVNHPCAAANDLDQITEESLLSIAAGCEKTSEHHLAVALLKKAHENGVEPITALNMQAVPGKGVYAEWNNRKVAVGNLRLFDGIAKNWPASLADTAKKLQTEGKTVIYIVVDDQPAGVIALADQLRPAAQKTIDELRKLGVEKIVMLTGDNEQVARNIADQLKLDEVYAELLPNQKLEIIERLKSGGQVAMVGDGVNDAPALAASDLGIAMGAAGTDVALETSDIVLMADDLTKLPYLLKLSRKSKKIVWQNITFSLAVIIMLLAGVFIIDLPLTAGVIGHEGSTLLVVLNGLRLLKSGGGGL